MTIARDTACASPFGPFALMIDPQSVFEHLERSERLERLQRRVCRPLDRPLIAHADDGDVAAHDRAIDGDPDASADEIGAASLS